MSIFDEFVHGLILVQLAAGGHPWGVPHPCHRFSGVTPFSGLRHPLGHIVPLSHLSHRQIAVFGSVALVFSAIGVNQGIFTNVPSLEAMAAGWLLLTIVNILWVLYFTSEENSLTLHLFNTFGTGGLTGPGRNGFRPGGRRMTGSHVNMQNGGGVGYTGGMGVSDYASPSMMGGGMGISGGYDTKEPGIGGMDRSQPDTSQRSLGGGGASINSVEPGSRAGRMNEPASRGPDGLASPSAMPQQLGASHGSDMQNPSTPLMASGNPGSSGDAGTIPDTYLYRAKALYACE